MLGDRVNPSGMSDIPPTIKKAKESNIFANRFPMIRIINEIPDMKIQRNAGNPIDKNALND
jgi:hypothetical protein